MGLTKITLLLTSLSQGFSSLFREIYVYQSSIASFENLPLINLASKEAPL